MAELPEIYLGSTPIYEVAVGDINVGWEVQPPGLSDTVKNFVTASGITDSTQIAAVNGLWNELEVYGFTDRFYALYPFVGGTETAHSYNLVDTGSYQINYIGNWTHDANGVTGDGSTAYGRTDVRLDSGSVGAWNSDGAMGLYSRTSAASGYDIGGYTNGARQIALIARYDANDDSYFLSYPISAQTEVTPSPDGSGLYVGNARGGASEQGLYRNGTLIVSESTSDDFATTGAEMWFGAANAGNTPVEYSDRNYALMFFGKGFSEAEQADLYTIVQNYQTALSREV